MSDEREQMLTRVHAWDIMDIVGCIVSGTHIPGIHATVLKEKIRSLILTQQQPGADFVTAFNELANDVNQTAIDKGWWKGDRNEGEIIALMHSELSEALEALRHGNPPDNHIPEFSGVEAEYADVIIRIMDMAAAKGYRVGEAVVAKMAYNKTRPHKHGGKKF